MLRAGMGRALERLRDGRQEAEDARGHSQRHWKDAHSPPGHPHPHPSSPAASRAVGTLLAPDTSVGDEFCLGCSPHPGSHEALPITPSPVPAARLVPSPPYRRVRSHGRLRLASRPRLVPQPSLGSSWLPVPWPARPMAEGCQPSVALLGFPTPRSTGVPGHELQGAVPLHRQSSNQTLAYSK